jgi:hypothetical protein
MSADLLRSRALEDFTRAANEQAEILVLGRQLDVDAVRHTQGTIAGLRLAAQLLDERFKNLHGIG